MEVEKGLGEIIIFFEYTFSFIDAVKSWEVSFNNIPFHYDVVPAD